MTTIMNSMNSLAGDIDAEAHTLAQDIDSLSTDELYTLCTRLRGMDARRWARAHYRSPADVEEAAFHRREVDRIVASEEAHERYLHSWGQSPVRDALVDRARYLHRLLVL